MRELVLGLLISGPGCSYDLGVGGKRCDPAHPCPQGYICTPDVDGEKNACLDASKCSAGAGTFVHMGSFATGVGPRAIAIADIDSDDILDLFTANHDGKSVSILLGDGENSIGNGSFRDGGQPTFTTLEPEDIGVGDFNHDQVLDIAVSGYDNVRILLGDGVDGKWQGSMTDTTPLNPVSPYETPALAVTDLDSDQHLDIVTGNTNGYVQVFHGQGDGAFVSTDNGSDSDDAYWTGHLSRDVVAIDLNGDNALDLVVAAKHETTDRAAVLLQVKDAGQPTGTFENDLFFPTEGQPNAIWVTDVSGDGVLDIITANRNDGTISLLVGEAREPGEDPSFLSAKTIVVGTDLFALAVVDLNGDDLLDLVITDLGSNEIEALLTQEVTPLGWALTPSWSFVAGDGRLPLATADFNKDGILDLVVASEVAGQVEIFFGLSSCVADQ